MDGMCVTIKWLRERELFFYTHSNDWGSIFCLSWCFLDHDDPLCFYNFMLFGFKSGRVGLEKEKFFVHYCQRTSCSEDLGLKTLILMKGNLHLKEWIMKDWHSFLDLEIVCHNARKFDIDVPIHNGHHCIGAPASAPPACTTMFFTHDDHEFSV